MLNACLQEKFFEFYRTNNNLCYSCFTGLFNDNKYKECEFLVQCNDNNIENVVNDFKEFLKFFEGEFSEDLFHQTVSLLTWSMLHEFQCPRELLRQQRIGDKLVAKSRNH